MSQTERIKFIDDVINERGIVSVNEVLFKFEVSCKTVKRDVEYLKQRLSAPIIYDKGKRGYIYTGEFSLFKFYDEKALLFSSFLKKIIECNEFIPVISDKLLKDLRKIQSKTYKNLSDSIVYDLPTHQFPDVGKFKIFMESIMYKRQCLIKYTNLENAVNERFIEPLKIINYSGQWYILSYCHVKKGLRTFSLSRVDEVFVTDKKFSYKSDLSKIEEHIGSSFGIMKSQLGNENIRFVTIRFYNRAILIVKNQVFHPQQKVVEMGNYMDFSFPVADYREILGRVLQYGPDAEVVAPDDFRELWRETIREMYHKFV